MLPEDFIISRKEFEKLNAPMKLKENLDSLSARERHEVFEVIKSNDFTGNNSQYENKQIQSILDLYKRTKYKS